MRSLTFSNSFVGYFSTLAYMLLFLDFASVSADTVISSSSLTQTVDSDGKVRQMSILSSRQANATHSRGVQIISAPGKSSLYEKLDVTNEAQIREKRQASSAAAAAAAASSGGGRGGSSSASAAAASSGGGRGLGGGSSSAAASAAASSSGGGNRFGGGGPGYPGRYGGGPGRFGNRYYGF